ncbi:8-amino-7-oxononanoate synthase [Methylotuvimicrobium sp. KM2]|uniref:8-amino-7-oxononanoate synthase n=1 Tax=Methylotuvimicrobium sp. KM2 TaxID=3133976 RepID=UPI0031019BA5
MIGIESGLDAELERLAREDLYRTRRVVESAQGVELQCGGRKLINFCSNDYLGLANHPAVVKAFQDGAARYGVGSGSAHLICGHGRAHHALEEELAEFTGRDRALLFSTGYMANIGVISALTGRGDTVFEDRLNHASLLDGGLLSGARFKRYRHADAEGLLDSLSRTEGRAMIVTDGVFSMDGDLAPLDVLSQIAKEQDAWLMVDDAHGLGVIGDKGRGIVEYFGLTQQQVPILVGTLGKAFGTFGAFVAGSETLIETLIQKARTYIYTTALPPAVAEATRAALNILIEDQWRRENLNDLVRRFRRGAEQLGFPLMPSNSAIQPILIGDSRRAVEIGKRLLDDGFWVGAIRPPTVPQGSARLRVTFSALHEEQQVDRLLESLAKSISQ